MESQQDKQHLQAPAKMTPYASQKITYKSSQFALLQYFVRVSRVQFGGRNTAITETL